MIQEDEDEIDVNEVLLEVVSSWYWVLECEIGDRGEWCYVYVIGIRGMDGMTMGCVEME